MDVCFEPDFSTEPPDVVKDPEHAPTRKPLIEPVTATTYDKRKQGQQLSRGQDFQSSGHSGGRDLLNHSSITIPTSLNPLQWLVKFLEAVDKTFSKIICGRL